MGIIPTLMGLSETKYVTPVSEEHYFTFPRLEGETLPREFWPAWLWCINTFLSQSTFTWILLTKSGLESLTPTLLPSQMRNSLRSTEKSSQWHRTPAGTGLQITWLLVIATPNGAVLQPLICWITKCCSCTSKPKVIVSCYNSSFRLSFYWPVSCPPWLRHQLSPHFYIQCGASIKIQVGTIHQCHLLCLGALWETGVGEKQHWL